MVRVEMEGSGVLYAVDEEAETEAEAEEEG